MWEYQQSTGLLSRGGRLVDEGYSGAGGGLDNPADEGVPDVGPIPVGTYTIGPPFTHPIAGPVTMRLHPKTGTDTRGRDGFMIHGDNAAANHSASEGCIILARTTRNQIAASDDDTLVVVA